MIKKAKEMVYRPREVVRIVKEWMLNKGVEWFSIDATDEKITIKQREVVK